MAMMTMKIATTKKMRTHLRMSMKKHWIAAP